jgi:predicted flavoprotein YhiN
MTAVDDHCMLKEQPGIYVTGELLDTDGICGGYNLHFAWMTGIIAGESASC